MTVANIRLQDTKITKEPIVYYWWFKTACFSQLLSLLDEELDNEIRKGYQDLFSKTPGRETPEKGE